jgi:RNA polymerase sigma-70 factor (ECF subfamily)
MVTSRSFPYAGFAPKPRESPVAAGVSFAKNHEAPGMTNGNPSSEQESDIALMQRSGQGDLAAFQVLVERHQHAVIGTAAKMLGNPAEAEDIAQMVFLRAWKSASRYQPDAKFTTWLMTITRNLVFNEGRRKKRARLEPLEPADEFGQPIRQIPDTTQMPADKEAIRQEVQSAIDQAIASLPEKPRVALILRRYENMPYEEIAKVLKTSVPSVKSLLFRARVTLKEQLKEFLD